MDKQINELTQIDELSSDDLLLVYDRTGTPLAYPVKLKKESVEKFLIVQNRWDVGEPNRISCSGINLKLNLVDSGLDGIIARITAFDAINSIQGGDGSQITYGISKDEVVWSENVNPMLAYVDYTCADQVIPGTAVVFLRVSDDSFTSEITGPVLVIIDDPNFYCP